MKEYISILILFIKKILTTVCFPLYLSHPKDKNSGLGNQTPGTPAQASSTWVIPGHYLFVPEVILTKIKKLSQAYERLAVCIFLLSYFAVEH